MFCISLSVKLFIFLHSHLAAANSVHSLSAFWTHKSARSEWCIALRQCLSAIKDGQICCVYVKESQEGSKQWLNIATVATPATPFPSVTNPQIGFAFILEFPRHISQLMNSQRGFL